MEEKYKDIEIRSEEVQEIMGQIPAWIIRCGITLLFIVVLALVIGSCFFKYPDIITAQVMVTTINPPAAIVSRASGKIKKLYVSDKQRVNPGDYLAVIENTARTEDILLLKSWMDTEEPEVHIPSEAAFPLQLGDIQSVYITYLNAAREYRNFSELGFYEKKIDFQRKQIHRHEEHYERMERQAEITEDQFRLAGNRWEKDSLMHQRGGISGPERDNSKSAYLQSLQSLESAKGGLENQQIQIAQLKEDFLNLQLEKLEKEGKIANDFNHAREQLIIACRNWELQYALLSPVKGQVTFTTYWSENHTIGGGETVFVVVPEEGQEIVGKALLPIARSGKVKEGQRVNVRFANYPDQEYGMVEGVVNSISLVPVENNYMIGISFPNGLMTNYKKILPLSQEMTGSADIITDDLRLIERFLQPIKKMLFTN
ncbi:HlyD family efflux transporter periplasmic adaptor subunit [Parabacteroides sp. 52]|uniref:HlyD family secretion protein n=1 Tax=unclassified Parabacteroides TaxID=2649774 RepID=UPI0013D1C2E7|nr:MULTISPECIES: HlyD family efflux transporter periplasmic adaptor subunit [unclassified Parabacteroides]MDH6533764.1 multidrug resistance efflux pump [Parabacteroides sp. PM5-20]NDV54514.1 HlyD family efflux transporter periplasmic adaptor subunit [Parabacteroides sp. 52]